MLGREPGPERRRPVWRDGADVNPVGAGAEPCDHDRS